MVSGSQTTAPSITRCGLDPSLQENRYNPSCLQRPFVNKLDQHLCGNLHGTGPKSSQSPTRRPMTVTSLTGDLLVSCCRRLLFCSTRAIATRASQLRVVGICAFVAGVDLQGILTTTRVVAVTFLSPCCIGISIGFDATHRAA